VFSQQSGFEFLLETVAFTLDANGYGVVQHPVQNSTGDDLVAENFAPLEKAGSR